DRDGHDQPERNQNPLRPPPVPAGDAVHARVEPVFQVGLQLGLVSGCLRLEDRVGLLHIVRQFKAGGGRILDQIDYREREVSRRNIRRQVALLVRGVAALEERVHQAVVVDLVDKVGRVLRIADQLADAALKVARAVFHQGFEELIQPRADQAEEQKNKKHPDDDVQNVGTKHDAHVLRIDWEEYTSGVS